MSQNSRHISLLTGSLNLLSPGDKIPQEDCLQAENFRSDQFGALRTRPGYSLVAQLTNAAERIHSLFRWGNVFFICAGQSLYRFPELTTPIQTGLDGNPIGMAFMQGYGWLMNKSIQAKTTGYTVLSWGLSSPTSAPVADSSGDNSDANGLTGTYSYLVTFGKADGAESNPSPQSNDVVLTNADGVLSSIPISTDPAVTKRFIYRQGGTLGQPYRVAVINDNHTTTLALDSLSDTKAEKDGLGIAFDHDAPPAAAGLVGPYFARLLAYNSDEHPNRMWWTPPNVPDYFPGASFDSGQWVDIGDDNEAILRITIKARQAIIYKERSIWRLTGDPDSGTLEKCSAKFTPVGGKAIAEAGQIDYVMGSEGVYSFDGDSASKITLKLDPIFQGSHVALGSDLTIPPIDADRKGQSVLEYANDRLLISYPEASAEANTCTLMYDLLTGRFASERMTAAAGYDGGFTAIQYVHPEMWAGNQNKIISIEMGMGIFAASTPDPGGAVTSFWQSRYEDCGQPDLDKVLTDVVIEAETGAAAPTLILLTDNGVDPAPAYTHAIGSVIAPTRRKVTFGLANETTQGVTAKNFSLRLEATATNQIVIHSVTFYYYLEAPALTSATSRPFLLQSGTVFEVKEMQVDANNPDQLTVSLSSDLPGNELAVRVSPNVPTSTTRRPYQLPFLTIEGRLFQVTANSPTAFRLYSVRMLVRAIGVYVEGYEAAAGFVWDSEDLDFTVGVQHVKRGFVQALYTNPIKRAREIELQIETAGPVTLRLLSDLPGSYMGIRWESVVDTSATAGRRVVRIPLQLGLAAPIEGRMFRLQLSGSSQFKLYQAAVELLAVGTSIEAAQGAAGAVYDSREMDFGTMAVKEFRQLDLDFETEGTVTAEIFTDQPGGVMTSRWKETFTSAGRQSQIVRLPEIEGRLLRLVVSSPARFSLYKSQIYLRAFGQYLTADAGASGAYWDSTELDLGSQTPKQLRQIEIEMNAAGPVLVQVYTDLPAGMQLRYSTTVPATSGRQTVEVQLPQPENYLYGRRVRVTVASVAAVKLFGMRVDARPVGVYVDGGGTWDSTPISPNGADRAFDEVRFEMDADGPVTVAVSTELPGETMTQRYVAALTTGAILRRWVTVPLPTWAEGRSIRLVVGGAGAFRLYKVQTRARWIGRYIAGNTGGVNDGLRTLEFDYGTERVKLVKKIELDIQTDGPLTLNASTELYPSWQTTVDTGGARKTLKITLPMNFRGRLVNFTVVGPNSGRLFNLRTWIRPVNEAQAAWSWVPYPLEPSSVLPEWSDIPVPETPAQFSWADLPVEPTPPSWAWAPFPVAPTDAQWSWAQVLSVDKTPPQWDWITVPGIGAPGVD